MHHRRLGQRAGRLQHLRAQRQGHLAVRLRDRAHAEIKPQHLGLQIAYLALGQVVARAQHADERQRPRAELPARHAWRKRCPAGLAARRAAPAVQAVFAHLRAHHGHLEDLMPHGLACRHHRRAALAYFGGGAVDDLVDLSFVHQRAVTARMTLLRPALAWAGTALGPVGAARAVRGRGLGRRLGVQRDALVQPGDFLLLLGHHCTSVSITSWHCARVGGLGASTPGASSATGSVACMAVVLHYNAKPASPTL